MQRELICVNSDVINRDGYCFVLSGLEKTLRDLYDKGTPMCIGHDMHRTVGWMVPFGIYIEPKLARVLATRLIATDDTESKAVTTNHEAYINRRYFEAFERYKDTFLALIGEALTNQHIRIDAGCVAVVDKGIATKCFPYLFSQRDDVGLNSVTQILEEFKYLGQGIFKHKSSDLAIYAHRYFRRSQSVHNNFHFSFLDELLSHSDNKDVTLKLCLDEDMIGYAPSFHQSMELEYYWGPKYSDDISQIKFGITRHETNDFERSYYEITRTEFLWKRDENEMTFEVEELRDQPSPFESTETYHCRYMHAIFNVDTQDFFHFDGAIRSYSLEEMSDRLDKTFLEYGRKAIYKKLFRIDGKLPLSEWKLLVTRYLQGNPLVYEYFGLKNEYEAMRVESSEQDASIQPVPHAIGKEDGIRLLVSYFPLPEDLKDGRYIDIYDIMSTDGEDKIQCTEHTIYELKKALERIGHSLEIASDVMLVKCPDRYWNIPSIMHSGHATTSLLEGTRLALTNLFASMVFKEIDLDIAFTWGFIVEGRLVRISSYGNIKAQLSWLSTQFPIPLDSEKFGDWVVTQREYISSFPVKVDQPPMASIVQNDGVLFLKRRHVHFPYEWVDKDGALAYEMKIPTGDDNDKILSSVEAGEFSPFLLSCVEECQWSDTGEDYFQSTRSKWLDKTEAAVNISKWYPLALYWSKSGGKDCSNS